MAFERSRAILGRMGIAAPERPATPHIVDTLIAERSRELVAHPFWPVLRPFLHRILHDDVKIEAAAGKGTPQ